MENTQTAVADSSPAPQQTFEIPTDPQANLEWRKTGELPAARGREDATKEAKPKEESAPSKTASVEKSTETAAAPATAPKQERAKSEAAARLDEVLADLKRAGLTPAELKTFKRDAQAATETAPAKTPETTVNPQGLTAPVKPKESDYANKTWEEFQEALSKYYEDYADFKAKSAVAEDRQARAAEAQQQTLAAKVADAKARYGEQTEATIGEAVRSVLNGEGVHPIVKVMLNESILAGIGVDVMYVLGSKPEELASFVELAKSNPGAAIRKVALLEHLVEQELAKGSTGGAANKGAAADTGRDETGKFVSQTPPAKQKPAAPPPPEELNTRGSAPSDPIDAAVRNGDFSAFKAEEDRRDLARRRGA